MAQEPIKVVSERIDPETGYPIVTIELMGKFDPQDLIEALETALNTL